MTTDFRTRFQQLASRTREEIEEDISAIRESDIKQAGEAYSFFKQVDPDYVPQLITDMSSDELFAMLQRYNRVKNCGKLGLTTRKDTGKPHVFHFFCGDYKACEYCNNFRAKVERDKLEAHLETSELYVYEIDTKELKYDTLRKAVSRAGGDMVKRIPQPNNKVVAISTVAPPNVAACDIKRVTKDTLDTELPISELGEVLRRVPHAKKVTGKSADSGNAKTDTGNNLTYNMPVLDVDGVSTEDLSKAWLAAIRAFESYDPHDLTFEEYTYLQLGRINAVREVLRVKYPHVDIMFYNKTTVTLREIRKNFINTSELSDAEILNWILPEHKAALEHQNQDSRD